MKEEYLKTVVPRAIQNAVKLPTFFERFD